MIKPYKISDKDSLIDIFKRNIPTYFDPQELSEFTEYLDQFSDTYLTIEFDGKIVGGFGYYINESAKTGSVMWIFFHPDYSGQGLGRKAVEYCHKLLSQDERVEKFVVRTSQHANGFFEKFGYKTFNFEKDYWGKGLDLYEMEKSIT